MILYEFEGKQLLQKAGILVPSSQLIEPSNQDITIAPPCVLKAQTLSGKRAATGGIVFVDQTDDLSAQVAQMFAKVINNEKVTKVLVEKKVKVAEEFYLSLSYDTDTRGPLLTLSKEGGTGVEERQTIRFPIDPLTKNATIVANFVTPKLQEIIRQLTEVFFDQDMLLLEINPLARRTDGSFLALDAKINLDDTALSRHPGTNFPPRSVPGHTPSKQEIAAKKIDENDYRGTAGSAYFDLNGDIAILASGGGASLVAMDALLAAEGQPANYTEYSGNPPKEKVEKLTQIVLSKKNLHGLWIVGAIANFTDIYETLSGIVEVLRRQKPLPIFPIVIRRGGPRDKEAFTMLQQIKDLELHLFGEETSITKSAEVMAKLAYDFASKEAHAAIT